MEFCRLKKADASIIADINGIYFADGWTLSQLSGAFSNAGFNLIATKQGEVITGYISFTVGMDFCDIEDVFTLPDYRKKGIATSLITHAESVIKEYKVHRVLLEVRISNAPAINLYKKLGYKPISVRKKYYNDGEDAIIMQKEL